MEPVSSTGSEIQLTIVIGDHLFYVQKPTGSSGLLRSLFDDRVAGPPSR